MTEQINLQGIYPPIPTPFSQSGRLDSVALTDHLRFLDAFDLQGLVLLGSNGEAVHLDAQEQVEVISTVRRLLPDRRLIAGAGGLSTAQSIQCTIRTAEAGADAVLILPPYYYRGQMTPPVLTRHFHVIADASPVPVILYNMPACTGIDMDVETLASIAQHENIVALKDSSGDVAKLGQLRARMGGQLQILAGSAGFLLPALSVGCAGGIVALANIAPAQCVQIYTHAMNGDWEQARREQIRLIRLNHAVTRQWGVAGLKAAMNLLGLPGGSVRPPLQDLADEELHVLRALLVACGLSPKNEQRSVFR